ncbi:MAG: AAA family ATPase [Candidatus Hydrogenedentota bacterium]
MFLKEIELFGFKSFADKTNISFNDGITMIVGPNGCGKSNILDAVRWVLGEQSAKLLRGGRMEDVIFNGTKKRPALNFAEITLLLDNTTKFLQTELSEVSITRRLFRDGESIYLLNKQPCRLKDIVDLFLDTGIGKSAYSIIEQGRIDLIINFKPLERRTIFEEASGINKYKHRRDEAVRKLDDTNLNLLRLRDIQSEMEKRFEVVSKQAFKARRYNELNSELKEIDVLFNLKEHRDLSERIIEIKKELGDVKNEEQNLALELKTIEKTRNLVKENIVLNENKHNQLIERKTEIIKRIENIKTRIEAITQNKEDRLHRKAKLENEFTGEKQRYHDILNRIKDIGEQQEKIKIEIEETEKKLKNIGEINDNHRQQLALFDDRFKVKDTEKYISLKKEIENLITKLIESKKIAEDKNSIIDELIEDLKKLNENITNKIQEIEDLQKQKDELNKTSENLNKETNNIKEKYLEIKKQNEYLSKLQQDLKNTENDLIERIENIKNELSGLNEELEKKIDRDEADFKIEISQYDDTLNLILQELGRLNKDREEYKTKLDTTDLRTREINTRLRETQEINHSLELKIEKALSRIEMIETRVRDEYNINLKELSYGLLEKVDSWAENSRKRNSIKREMSELGAINFEANNEYEELKTRRDFLNSQIADLEKARDDLTETIKKIDVKSTQMFIETFNLVRNNFQLMFRTLFDGGEADLTLLTDQANILECGIEIIAQPPGKKPQTIALLSGGEKALCAIALVFAIFLVKPSPFCILDEVDAPLDESNIDRFVKLLREFTKKTQFLIISHNKKTIEIADQIYGVTQYEPGLSSIISLKLEDTDNYIEKDVKVKIA